MDTKSLHVEVKDASQGKIKAVFSTFGVVDKDGDVTLPTAFTDGAPVRISAYDHASWGGALPVGKGVIRVEGNQAVLDGEFFMNTTHGRDHFETVKALGPLGEWSYGYEVLDAEPGTQDGKSVQVLKRLEVYEVSPVLLGAGVNTRTLDAKSYEAKTSLNDELAHAMDVVGRVIESAERVAALRAEKGKALSQVNAEVLAGIDDGLTRLKALLCGDAGDGIKGAANHTDHTDELMRMYARLVSTGIEERP